MDRKLSDIFIVPPISVLDVKQKYWKDRRKQWLALNIQSELGRSKNLLKLSPLLQKKQKATSVFDPVLCEIMYKWFSTENDTIFDPFAGGSVRGIVASKLQRYYEGVDIRPEQVNYNIQQALDICNSYIPRWIVGSADMISINRVNYDFFFTCPPYYDLEKYSEDKNDLSNMLPNKFEEAYNKILKVSLAHLKMNRFAAIIVGDVRDENGIYRQFPQKTIKIFEENNCKYYNDLILLQEPATAAMRSFNYMNSSRKIAKCHQNVLIFVKGDVTLATARLQPFENTTDNTLSNFFV